MRKGEDCVGRAETTTKREGEREREEGDGGRDGGEEPVVTWERLRRLVSKGSGGRRKEGRIVCWQSGVTFPGY